MADYMAANIEIGGKLPQGKLTELLSLIDDLSAEGYCGSPPNQEFLVKCTDNKKPVVLYDDQARYGEFEELEQFCIKNNLTFKRQSSPKYEYEGQIRFFSPDSGDRVIGATDDGELYLKLSELEEYQKKGLTLPGVIEKLKEYDGNVPSLELIEEPKTGEKN